MPQLLLAGACSPPAPTFAAAVPHVRGEVIAITGDIATVQPTAGETVEVTMKPDFGMWVYRKIAIEDLKPDDYCRSRRSPPPTAPSRPSRSASSPLRMHGVREGESALGSRRRQPDDQRRLRHHGVAQGADHSIVVTYKGTQETVSVPEGTPIMAFGPAPDRKLAVGDNAIFFATEVDGKLTSDRAGIMEDGSVPPM